MTNFIKNNWLKSIFIICAVAVMVGWFYYSPKIAEARSGCCSWHGGVCSYKCPDGVNLGYACCDGTSLSAKCAPYYASCPLVAPKPKPKPAPKIDYTAITITSADVTRVIDGDTIEVKLIDGAIAKVRFIGIDTPETVDPRKPVECFGKEAGEKLKSMIDKKEVTLKRDAINDNKDIYNRLLRYVYLDDKDINAEMIKQGYAYAYLKYSFDNDKMSSYKDYEKQAREKELGLWAPGVCDNPIKKEPTVLGIINKDKESEKGLAPKAEESNEDDFEGGFLMGVIVTLFGVIGYKIIKKRYK
ncbi:thermonuclease family protein [Candidatus Parcubacteria bacterium]|nr:thermonuclease family protein [Candidatus Parcubacteria bacterium]